MNIIDGGCFMALSDSLAAVDVRLLEDFTRMDMLDRCNERDPALQLDACVIEQTKPGLWYVYALTESSGCEIDANRIADLICISASNIDPSFASKDYLVGLAWKDLLPNADKWHSDEIQIHCGTVGLLCMESIRRCAKAHGLKPDDSEEFSAFIRRWANTMCQITTTSSKIALSNFPGGPIGAVSSVGICDNGKYSCQVLHDDVTGEVSGIKITFPPMQ
ncbi:hypothetical protein BaOVIS_021710 [Babesia ovis]|uniref:Uncharacterized protein n=1 Tax=Babesia ovis TaxID=5869 RepID=A0A9W5TDX9_BABOV|nr:hypothetical protein BaOVIS_021710 [Babesia ovis]